MAWVWLGMASIAEVGWMVALKYAEGFTRLWWGAATVAIMALSVIFISFAVRVIPMGTAYAIWTGLGAAGIAIVGMLAFGEPRTAMRIGCIVLIVVGVAGLKLSAD